MKGEMITMKWNYNMNSCPIDTRVKLLSENKRNTFEGTITLSHDGIIVTGKQIGRAHV